MDTLTHALSGALLGRATARTNGAAAALPVGRRMLIGAIAAAFPDIDVVLSNISPLSYLYNHRGVTHSLLILPIWALLLSWIFSALWRGKPGWRAYLGIAALGIGAHIAGDLITSFGTMIFAPVSDARFGIGTTFIIDLWFTGIILAGLLASAVWRRTRGFAVGGLVVLAGYVAFQWILQQRAIDFGEAYVRANGLEPARVSAQPRPVSPFNWTVFVDDGQAYRYAHVNLVRKTPQPEPTPDSGFVARLDSAYRPLDDATWVVAGRYGNSEDEVHVAREAFDQPAFRFFRWFAAYPAVLRVDRGNPRVCVWFQDLRFLTPGRPTIPFRYGMCREEGEAWKPFELRGGQSVPVY